MTNNTQITIAKGLDISEVSCGAGFTHARVIDLRCDGKVARPIEESLLRRLNNHFVEYEQMPIVFGTSGPCQEVHLCESLRETTKDTLVIADDLTQLSAILGIYEIEFTSKSFYLVESGKGDLVRPVKEAVPAIAMVEDAQIATNGM
ncbi:MAG: hypothetical protein AAF412_03470 [Pseudomonadota bacterium]